jgi:hypothetical protein
MADLNNNIFQISKVRYKTPRMSHRFSLSFGSELKDILTRASKRVDLYSITGKDGAKNRYDWLSSAFDTANPETELELALLSCNLPPTEMEVVEASRFHDTARHITKFQTQGDMECTFYDYVNGSASAIMSIWQGLVGDRRTGAISYKREYSISGARLIEYGPTAPAEAEPMPLAEHAIVNLYPKTINLGEHSYESAQIRKVSVTFACDNIFPLYYNNLDPKDASEAETLNPLYKPANQSSSSAY